MMITSHRVFQTNPFLQALPQVEQHRIASLTVEAAELLTAWSAAYRIVRPVRILPICLSVAAAAPFADLQAIVDTARVSVWIFALDDVFDEGQCTQAELATRAMLYEGILLDRPTPAEDDELAVMLRQVKAGLAGHPLYAPLGTEWALALNGTIRAMLQENEWREAFQQQMLTRLPDYDAYLACGRQSVGGPPHMWAAILTTNDSTAIQQRDYLAWMVEQSSAIIRLANDLQTYERELREGKLNSLQILCQSPQCDRLPAGATIHDASQYVQEQIQQTLDQLEALGQQPRTVTGRPELALVRIAQYVAEFYRRNDFHTAMAQPVPG
jgi:hypothetical protein